MSLWSRWDSVRSTLGTRSLGLYSSHHPWRASSSGRRSTSTRCSRARWRNRREQASNTMRIVSFLFSILQLMNQPRDHLKRHWQRDHRSRTPSLEIGWPPISKQPSVRSSPKGLWWQIWEVRAESALISVSCSSKVQLPQNKVWLESVRYHLRILNLIKFSHHTASYQGHLTYLYLYQPPLQAPNLLPKLTRDRILQDSSILKQYTRRKSLLSRL